MTAPLRLVTELFGYDEDGAEARWTPTGDELGPFTNAQRPRNVSGTLVLEAMAQCAGLFLQRTHPSPGTYWMLTGIDNVDVDRRLAWGQELTLESTVRKRGTRAAVLDVSAATSHGEICHATILMHRL